MCFYLKNTGLHRLHEKLPVLRLSKQNMKGNLIMQSAILHVLDLSDIMYSHAEISCTLSILV